MITFVSVILPAAGAFLVFLEIVVIVPKAIATIKRGFQRLWRFVKNALDHIKATLNK